MSRAEELRERHEAELAVVELEEALLAAKDSGEVPRELKEALREARQHFRDLRAGDASASPGTIESVTDLGG
jgi:exonuclease VII small subunit